MNPLTGTTLLIRLARPDGTRESKEGSQRERMNEKKGGGQTEGAEVDERERM